MKILLAVGVFLLAVGTWLGAIVIVPWMSSIISDRYCAPLKPEICASFISTLGSTGDIFGAVTSLFSGLALFAVAITVWADSNSRRESRKPFMMTQLTSDSLMLFDPILIGEKSIKLIANLDVANQLNEAALNIKLRSYLTHNSRISNMPDSDLASPLMGNTSAQLQIEHTIAGADFERFLDELTGGKPIFLVMNLEYESIEGVRWSTSVSYEVKCIATAQKNRLNAARGNNEDFLEHWANDAAVALSGSPQSGTWRHKKV
jgi:hypothetical protein